MPSNFQHDKRDKLESFTSLLRARNYLGESTMNEIETYLANLDDDTELWTGNDWVDKNIVAPRLESISKFQLLAYNYLDIRTEQDIKLPGNFETSGDCVARTFATLGKALHLPYWNYRNIYKLAIKVAEETTSYYKLSARKFGPLAALPRLSSWVVDANQYWLESVGWQMIELPLPQVLGRQLLERYANNHRTFAARLNTNHIVAVVDGEIFDTWDSRFDSIPGSETQLAKVDAIVVPTNTMKVSPLNSEPYIEYEDYLNDYV